MACGVHLGIFLICLVQAEHVRCLWAEQAQRSQRQNGNTHVGFVQQYSGLGRLGASYPQNQLRQSSAQSSSFNTKTGVSSGYSQGLSSSGHAQTLSQPAQSGHSSVKFVQSSSLSKPNWRVFNFNQVNAPKEPKKQFLGLSTSIASGSSVSKYNPISKKRTWPVQQGTPQANRYQSSSFASLQSPSRKSKSFSPRSAAQKASSAAETPTYGSRGYSPMKSSSLFNVAAPVPQGEPVRMHTSASAPGTRVTSRSRSQASKPSFSRKPETATSQRLNYKPSSTGSLQTSWNSRNSAQGARNLHASGSGRTGNSGQRFAPTRIHSIPERYGGFSIRRLKKPADEKPVRKPQQTYTAPSWERASPKPQAQSIHQESKWMRVKGR